MGLVITFALGLSIVIGAFIVFISNNNRKFINFSIGLALSVILMLIVVDLFPETYEIFSEDNHILVTLLIILIATTVGFCILKLLDHYIPEHDDNDNLEHIGMMTSIALVIHNIIEGMAVYNVTESDFKLGMLIAVGVGLHNIPLGMIITSAFYKIKKSIKKVSVILLGLSLSTFLGGLLMFFASNLISEMIEGILLGITLGMLIYISCMELLPKIMKTKDKKSTFLGIVAGILILIITMFI